MPAVPLMIQGGMAVGGALASKWAGKKAAASAMERTPTEQMALASGQQTAARTGQNANQLFANAMPAVGNATNYYQTLLSGGRGARRAATAGEAADIGSAYKGADTAVGKSYMQGGERNAALAENARQRVGAVSKLTTGVRPGAAQGLAAIGSNLIGQAGQQYGTSAAINSNIVGQEYQNRLQGQQAGADSASKWGGLFAQLSSMYKPGMFGKGGGGGGGNGLSANWESEGVG